MALSRNVEAVQHLGEFGVSVSPSRRGHGYGQQLFERAVVHARNHGVSQLIVYALSENTAMLRIARKAGAFEKVDVPYTEFKWADFLRSRIPVAAITMSQLDQAIAQAAQLARSPEAEGLPGYLKTPPAPPVPDLAAIRARLRARHGAADEPQAANAHQPHRHKV